MELYNARLALSNEMLQQVISHPRWLVITLTLPTRSLGCWKLHALDIVRHDSICRSFYLRALLLSRYCPAERTGKLDYATFFHCRCSAQ